MKPQPIAIIGGMGPEASVYFYNILIKQSVAHFNAVNNDDFPEILLYSIPVPDFISSNDSKNKALGMLQERVRKINTLNPLCLGIACNTAHVLLDDLQQVSTSPFISMIEKVVENVKKDNLKTVGLLGTPSTLRSYMYQDALKKEGIESVIPDEKDFNKIELIVRHIIAGSANKNDNEVIIDLANSLKNKGAEGIILGCTELPLIFPQNYLSPIYNSVEILSMALLKKYFLKAPIRK